MRTNELKFFRGLIHGLAISLLLWISIITGIYFAFH
ncbi:hypothetical protein HNQ56_001306 [Anaerotaenia torta]